MREEERKEIRKNGLMNERKKKKTGVKKES
jgi:hypothetical protein